MKVYNIGIFSYVYIVFIFEIADTTILLLLIKLWSKFWYNR